MTLSPNYRLVFDENNVVLQYYDIRERQKKDGRVEEYEYQDNTFHSTVAIALRAFLHKSIKGASSIEDCLKRIQQVEDKIDQLLIEKERLNQQQ